MQRSPESFTFDSPQGRQQISEADVVLGLDKDEGTRVIFSGRDLAEEIVRSGVGRPAKVVWVPINFMSDEPERLDAVVRAEKGKSSFRPADLFPEMVVDDASFPADMVGPVRQAVEKLRAEHRQLLPIMQRRFYYSVAAAGFEVSHQQLRQAAEQTRMPQAYYYCLLTLGHILYGLVPPSIVRRDRCIDVVHGTGSDDRKLLVRCRSLEKVHIDSVGQTYFSPRKPKLWFSSAGREGVIAFSRHAVERICERTVYDWRSYAGHGDAFAYLYNCVCFEDCSAAWGCPCFAIWELCLPTFSSWRYVEEVLGGGDPGDNYHYRVGYCKVDFCGEFARARTLLVPGMRETPERRLIEASGLPATEVAQMEEQVEKQLSMKDLADSGDYSLVKWFHDNGVPQVMSMDPERFVYD